MNEVSIVLTLWRADRHLCRGRVTGRPKLMSVSWLSKNKHGLIDKYRRNVLQISLRWKFVNFSTQNTWCGADLISNLCFMTKIRRSFDKLLFFQLCWMSCIFIVWKLGYCCEFLLSLVFIEKNTYWIIIFALLERISAFFYENFYVYSLDDKIFTDKIYYREKRHRFPHEKWSKTFLMFIEIMNTMYSDCHENRKEPQNMWFVCEKSWSLSIIFLGLLSYHNKQHGVIPVPAIFKLLLLFHADCGQEMGFNFLGRMKVKMKVVTWIRMS